MFTDLWIEGVKIGAGMTVLAAIVLLASWFLAKLLNGGFSTPPSVHLTDWVEAMDDITKGHNSAEYNILPPDDKLIRIYICIQTILHDRRIRQNGKVINISAVRDKKTKPTQKWQDAVAQFPALGSVHEFLEVLRIQKLLPGMVPYALREVPGRPLDGYTHHLYEGMKKIFMKLISTAVNCKKATP